MAGLAEIVIDSRHPAGLARFWAEVLDDYAVRAYDTAEIERLAKLGFSPDTDPSVAVDGPGPTLFFQRSDTLKTMRNRVHLDVTTRIRTEEVARFETLGARVRDEHDTFTVMLDPEGNEFCVRDRS